MAQHLKLIALLIFTLSASYTSAQSLRKLLERPYGIIESKWEKDAQGATELNYYNKTIATIICIVPTTVPTI